MSNQEQEKQVPIVIENTQNKNERTFTQDEVNSLIADRLKRAESKLLSDTEIKALKKENETLKLEMKTPTIKQAFLSAGGKEGKEFEDFLKLNSNLYEVENKDLNKTIKGLSKNFTWAFGSSTSNNNSNYDNNDDTISRMLDSNADNADKQEWDKQAIFNKLRGGK